MEKPEVKPVVEPDFSVVVDEPDNLQPNHVPRVEPSHVPLVPVEKPVEKPAIESMNVVKTNVAKPNVAKTNVVKQPNQIAETIEIANPQSIFGRIEAYPETSPKQHHFHFKNPLDRTHLIRMWSQIGITVEFNEVETKNEDVILMREGQLVGKIQFLHFDRRDRSIQSKHYVKVYLYQFEKDMLEKAKSIMRSFFQEIGAHAIHRSVRRSSTRKHKKIRSSRTRKHKKVYRRS